MDSGFFIRARFNIPIATTVKFDGIVIFAPWNYFGMYIAYLILKADMRNVMHIFRALRVSVSSNFL
jgi:hypothetical protein